MIEVQAAASRYASIRVLMSNASWAEGIGNFFREDIPFSFSTGQLFASRLARTIGEFAGLWHRPLQDETFRLMEYGAGLGLLSKHVLDTIEVDDPDLYRCLATEITDAEDRVIEGLADSDVLAAHEAVLSVYRLDARKPVFPHVEKTHFIYMAYLLDSLPAVHVRQDKDGQLYEVLVKTAVPEACRALDTTRLPPRLLDGHGIAAILRAGGDTRRILAKRLEPLLHEAFSERPLLENPELRESDKALLSAYVQAHQGPAFFNYPLGLPEFLEGMVSRLHETGAIFIYDFGTVRYEGMGSAKGLLSSYGVTSFCTVHFPLFRFYLEQNGFTSHLTASPAGHNQAFLATRGVGEKKMVLPFQLAWADLDDLTARDQAAYQADIQLGYGLKGEAARRHVLSFWEGLPALQQASYWIQISVAAILLENDFLDEAERFVSLSMTSYGPIALSSYLLMGGIAGKRRDLDLAQQYYERVLQLAPRFPAALNELAQVHGTQKTWGAYIDTMADYLRYTAEPDLCQPLLTLALVLLQEDDLERGMKILAWLRLYLMETRSDNDPFFLKLNQVFESLNIAEICLNFPIDL